MPGMKPVTLPDPPQQGPIKLALGDDVEWKLRMIRLEELVLAIGKATFAQMDKNANPLQALPTPLKTFIANLEQP